MSLILVQNNCSYVKLLDNIDYITYTDQNVDEIINIIDKSTEELIFIYDTNNTLNLPFFIHNIGNHFYFSNDLIKLFQYIKNLNGLLKVTLISNNLTNQFLLNEIRQIETDIGIIINTSTDLPLEKLKQTKKSLAGGTLTILTVAEQFLHLDPQRIYTPTDLAFGTNFLYRTLTSYAYLPGKNGSKLIPDMATNTGITEDGGQTWTFTLRNGITWQDGTPVTAADIAYGISRTFALDIITDGPTYAISLLNIPTNNDGGSQYPGPYKATKAQQALFDKAVIVKGNTITFKLKTPHSDFNETLTLPAFAAVPRNKDTKQNYDKNVISNGPYKIKIYNTNELTLVRNTKWKKSSDPIRNAYPDTITLKFKQQSETIFNNILKSTKTYASAISYDTLNDQITDSIKKNPQYSKRIINAYDPYLNFFAINVKKVNSLLIRQAIYLALDRQAILEAFLGKNYKLLGDLADGFIKPTLFDYKKVTLLKNLLPNGNPDDAIALLEEAKSEYPALYNKVRTTGLSVDLQKSEKYQKIGNIIKTSLNKAGIKINLNFIEPSLYYAVVMDPAKQGDISRSGWAADWQNPSTILPELFGNSGGFNLSQNINDPRYSLFNSLLSDANDEINREKQAIIWQEANQFAVDRVWAIPLSFNKYSTIYGTKIGGAFNWSPYGTYNFNSLYIKK